MKKRKSAAEIEAEMTGGEPVVKDKKFSELDMMEALNWYSSNRESKDAAKYLASFVKKNKLKVSAKVIDNQSKTFGFLCRMKMNGAIFTEKQDKAFRVYLETMLNAVDVDDRPQVVKTNTYSIQERMAEKISEVAGELEGSIDDYIRSEFKEQPSPYALMQDKVKGAYTNKLLEIFKWRRSEFDEVLHTNDDLLKEGYSNFSKSELKKLIAYCDEIITDILKFNSETKKSRKPRKRKVKTPDQLTAKLKFCEKNDEFGLKSIDAKQIVGAITLWVYNVKTRKLGVYHADDASGLSVKGSSIANYSESKSISKTLRKPDKTLPELMSAGKVLLRNLMTSIKAKESKLTGRINSDTILLRIS